jgi:acetyl esterase/lipase
MLPALLLLQAAATVPHVQPVDLRKYDVPPATHTLSYGSGSLQVGELRLPKTKGPHPVIMLIHGGCWMSLVQGAHPRDTTLDILRPLAEALTARGVASWNIEYRRAGDTGGGWPGSYHDVARAADLLREIAPKYNLDLKRVVAAGHSAGGQLSMWLAGRPKLPKSSAVYSANPLPIKAVLNIDGPPELATAQPVERKFCPEPGITLFLGGTPAQHPGRYREGSAQSLLPLGVPVVIAVGGLLQASPALVSSYQAAAASKGDRVVLLDLPRANHFDMLSPAHPHGKTLIDRLLALLD